jgi:hypothetical protein
MTFNSNISLSVGFTALILLATACATEPKPVVHSVCVEIKDMPEHETTFILKHTAQYLNESHFSQATTDCDVVVKFQPFGKFQGEVVGPLGAKSGYWSQEGSVTVIRGGVTVLEDEQISVRGQDTRQDALDALAWQVVKPVTKSFRPTR